MCVVNPYGCAVCCTKVENVFLQYFSRCDSSESSSLVTITEAAISQSGFGQKLHVRGRPHVISAAGGEGEGST